MFDTKKGFDGMMEAAIKRRSLMKTASLAAAGATAATLPFMSAANAYTTYTVTDTEVLNFALNLEYLEANYYLLGVTGQGVTNTLGGPQVTLKPSTTLVPFQTPQLAYYFQGIAVDEQVHVSFLQTALGSAAVPQPQIDLMQSFTTLAVASGLIAPGQTFNPFSSELAFLIGSYIFEDVGVTAYGGGAPYLANPDIVSYAASVLAVEGFHAGAIRAYLASQGGSVVTDAISSLRAKLSAPGAVDNGTSIPGGNPFNIVNSDSQGQSYRRTFNEVLNVVYGGASVSGGLFFPVGLQGTITNSGDTFNPQAPI